MLTDCVRGLHMRTGLGEGQRVDVVLGQIGRGEVGSHLESVVPPGEQEVRAQTDELLEREVVRRYVPHLMEGGQVAAGYRLAGRTVAVHSEVAHHV